MKNTLRALFPTEEHGLGFRYFDGAAAWPFEPAHGGPHWRKAWWCAQLALLAYTRDEDRVAQCLARGGLQGRLIRSGQAECLLAHDGHGHAWLAFRGTEIVTPTDAGGSLAGLVERFVASGWDWRLNLDFLPVAPVEGQPEKVHRGFLAALQSLEDSKLREAVAAVSLSSLWLTGHSLGAAIATLAAGTAWGRRASGLYTFGSPAVGNAAFGHSLHVPHVRIVNGRDAVPLLPPPGLGAVHAGRLAHLDVPSCAEVFEAVGVRDEPAGLLDALSPSADTVAAGFAHHAPLMYVAQCARQIRAGAAL